MCVSVCVLACLHVLGSVFYSKQTVVHQRGCWLMINDLMEIVANRAKF